MTLVLTFVRDDAEAPWFFALRENKSLVPRGGQRAGVQQVCLAVGKHNVFVFRK